MVEEKETKEGTKIKVYTTQLEGYCGPCVWKTVEGAVGELQGLLEDMAVGDSFTVTVEEMDEREFGNLEEFDGY